MGVRVKINLRINNKSLETVALANAGYESEVPEVMVPTELAKRFDLWPKLPKNARDESYVSIGGVFRTYRIANFVEVKVTVPDRETSAVRCDLVITEEEEVILSDRLIDVLEIDIVEAGKGRWRFRDEPVESLRKSKKIVRW